jgi:hypothetical protein
MSAPPSIPTRIQLALILCKELEAISRLENEMYTLMVRIREGLEESSSSPPPPSSRLGADAAAQAHDG